MDLVTVLMPSGPTVLIHKNWQHRKVGSRSATQDDNQGRLPARCSKTVAPIQSSTWSLSPRESRQRKYEFISSETPSKRKTEPGVLKVIRRHVRREFLHDVGQRKARTQNQSYARRLKPHLPITPFDTYLNAPPTLFSEYPIDLQTCTHTLLSNYLEYSSSRMFPIGLSLKTNPLKSPEWFRFAVTDPAMLHAMLYIAATYLALLFPGRAESKDAIYHQNQTISIVRERLGTSTQTFDDSTLGAISCLAIGGAISGNMNIWHLHMKGLKRMIGSTGNFCSLSPLLQAKLRRSDVTGAIDFGLTPYLDLPPPTTQPTWSLLPHSTTLQTTVQMIKLLNNPGIRTSLVQILTRLSLFSQAITLARADSNLLLSPESLSNDLYTLEHDLLSFPSTLHLPTHEPRLSAALRFSALIYLKAVLQEFPHSVTGSKILVDKVRESLGFICIGHGQEEEKERADLIAWMCAVCAAVTNGEVRMWFVGKIGRLQVFSATREGLMMESLLDLRSTFGYGCIDKIWEEAEI